MLLSPICWWEDSWVKRPHPAEEKGWRRNSSCTQTDSAWSVCCFFRPLPQVPAAEGRQERGSPTFPVVISHPEDDPAKLSAWIQERKRFISQLESSVDIEKWLRNKSSQSHVEERVWERIKSRRAERRAERKAAVTDKLGVSRCCVTSALGSLHCILCGLNQ